MNSNIRDQVTKDQLKQIPKIKVGDKVSVGVKIKERDKERVQYFKGLVIAKNRSGISQTITVRKISYGIGVERIFPVNSPTIDSIEVLTKGKVRKSKLYYIRKRQGKQALKVGTQNV